MVFTENRIYYHQHSFREDLSCTTQRLSVLHAIGISLDRGLETDVIYLDLTRAFDTVYHAHLLHKLYNLGIVSPLVVASTLLLTVRPVSRKMFVQESLKGANSTKFCSLVMLTTSLNASARLVLQCSPMTASVSARSGLAATSALFKKTWTLYLLGLCKTSFLFSWPSARICELLVSETVPQKPTP